MVRAAIAISSSSTTPNHRRKLPGFYRGGAGGLSGTADEDRIIIDRMEAGRTSLDAAGCNEAGPYQLPMEAGMQHFHRFLRRELGELG
jgi:choline monooxygenase